MEDIRGQSLQYRLKLLLTQVKFCFYSEAKLGSDGFGKSKLSTLSICSWKNSLGGVQVGVIMSEIYKQRVCQSFAPVPWVMTEILSPLHLSTGETSGYISDAESASQPH